SVCHSGFFRCPSDTLHKRPPSPTTRLRRCAGPGGFRGASHLRRDRPRRASSLEHSKQRSFNHRFTRMNTDFSRVWSIGSVEFWSDGSMDCWINGLKHLRRELCEPGFWRSAEDSLPAMPREPKLRRMQRVIRQNEFLSLLSSQPIFHECQIQIFIATIEFV